MAENHETMAKMFEVRAGMAGQDSKTLQTKLAGVRQETLAHQQTRKPVAPDAESGQ
jgi:hypothetical protein